MSRWKMIKEIVSDGIYILKNHRKYSDLEVAKAKRMKAEQNLAMLKQKDLSNKTNNLSKLNFTQREIIEDCASSNKEIEVYKNALEALNKRIDDYVIRFNKLTTQNDILNKDLDLINKELNPHKKQYDKLETILKKNF